MFAFSVFSVISVAKKETDRLSTLREAQGRQAQSCEPVGLLVGRGVALQRGCFGRDDGLVLGQQFLVRPSRLRFSRRITSCAVRTKRSNFARRFCGSSFAGREVHLLAVFFVLRMPFDGFDKLFAAGRERVRPLLDSRRWPARASAP